ncbi:hypothetical protein [Bradyrhizobium sp. WSM2793]|uniref:portal protein n=1 Tax=Bradyrhizobium sp. WSM2793 TaxID=1038866 RepID=UPI000367F857|nr:hypothetical protein [Bradyrhizobium sp. WSM2793]
MTINVGLGNGGKAQQFAQTMALANVQKEIVANGMTNVVDPGKIYNTAAELTKIMGHKNPDKFLKGPDESTVGTELPCNARWTSASNLRAPAGRVAAVRPDQVLPVTCALAREVTCLEIHRLVR